MKALKNLFVPSSPYSLCPSCQKRFRSNEPGQVCCSKCELNQDWMRLNAEQSDHFRRHPPRPARDPNALIKLAIEQSPTRQQFKSPGRHAAAHSPSSISTRNRSQSTFHSQPPQNRDNSGQPRPLSRKRSMSEHVAPRRTSPKSPASLPPITGSATPQVHTPRLARLPDVRRAPTEHRHGGRYDIPEPHMWAFLPPATPPSSDESSMVDEPIHRGFYDALGEPHLLSASPQSRHPLGPDVQHYVPSTDLTPPRPRATSAHPSPHITDTRTRTQTQPNTNAPGIALTLLLKRRMDNPPFFAPHPRVTRPSVVSPPYPRYPDNTLRPRPGYDQRRGPRPRSNSFGGFAAPVVRVPAAGYH